MKLVWTDQAAVDLDAIADFIAVDDPIAAVQWVEQLVATAERVPQSPRMGRKVPEFGREDVRELIHANYRIVYRIGKENIEVLTVFEGHRLLHPLEP
ncbi:MAG: type II toxin-antitoxin system RelE/ParE family toxin [Myxococcales bacterium]|nr:type II toxin-antitoxin system RelE/ParE family toxin [Myxococcales bacterium]